MALLSCITLQPSVRYRKTINTMDPGGRPVAVHAQQYAVLVTNVNQHVYPEYCGPKSSLGAGACGRPRVKYGGEDIWMGARYRHLAEGGCWGSAGLATATSTVEHVGMTAQGK